MKTSICILVIFLLFSCESESKNDETMKMVVNKYFSNIKEDKIEDIPNLFWNNDIYIGAIKADAFFIRKKYNELRIDSLINHIKIKDTTSIIPSQKQKYIQFTIKKTTTIFQ